VHHHEVEKNPWTGTGLHQCGWLLGNCLTDVDQAIQNKDTMHCTVYEYATMEKLVLLK